MRTISQLRGWKLRVGLYMGNVGSDAGRESRLGHSGRTGTPRFRHALCINPYYEESRSAWGFFPPTGLEYVASALATRVPRVTLADLRHDPAFRPERRLHEFIRRQGVDLLGVSVNWDFKFNEALGIVSRLPAEIFTIVGGQEATARVEEIMQRCPNVDAVARGEGEEIAVELASGKPLDRIAGLSHRRNGATVHNETRTVGPIRNLPERERSLRRVSYSVSSHDVKLLGGGFDTVLTSRGCPFNCKFCSFNLNPLGKKRGYDERPAESVFAEVRSLEADLIFFVDDNFFVNHKRVERLCDLLIESGVRKRYIAQARLELARNPRLLDKLVRAGFKMLFLGIESPQDRILKDLNKGFTSAEIREFFRTFRRYDIFYHGYFIYGNIGETGEEMLEIPLFARELGLDAISFQKLQARRFTAIKDVVEKTPGYYMTPDGSVYSDQYSIEDLRRIAKEMKREFYTPMRWAKGLIKMKRIGIVPWRDLAALPFRLLLILLDKLRKERKRRRRRKAGERR